MVQETVEGVLASLGWKQADTLISIKDTIMADEAPIQSSFRSAPKGGAKKDGFNLVTERVVAVNPEAKQLEVELLAYDGKTVVLDVDDEALEDLKKLKPGDGATIRVVEEDGQADREELPDSCEGSQCRQGRRDAAWISRIRHWLNRKYAAESPGGAQRTRGPSAVGRCAHR